MSKPNNVVVIGAGPAGEAAAKTLRSLSAETSITLIEKEAAGGLCLNKGCIPSKTLLEHVHHAARHKKPIDWAELQDIKNKVVLGIRTQLESNLKRQKIQFLHGHATFNGKSSLHVQNDTHAETVSFDKAIITTGTQIFYPPPLDKYKDDLLNSDKVLELNQTPKSILIIGGGAIGLEFACLLNAAGSQVTVVEMMPGILFGEDPAVVSALTRSFESRGIVFKTGTKVTDLEKTASGWKVKLQSGDTLEPEQVLACVGRIPNPNALALDKAEIQSDKDRIILNENLQTTNPNVYAAGDAATTRLAHAAASQAEVAAANVLGQRHKFDDQLVPRCLYTWPEVASVGQWKYQLEEKGAPVKASRAFYKGSARALASDETEGFVQVVSDPNSKKILGAQIIGAHATELIHIFSVALKANMTTDQLGDIIFAHPTLSELARDAAKK